MPTFSQRSLMPAFRGGGKTATAATCTVERISPAQEYAAGLLPRQAFQQPDAEGRASGEAANKLEREGTWNDKTSGPI